MNAILRHLSVRLWATVLIGGLILLALMPQWQRVAGMGWITLPVLVVLVGCFVLIGWLMNRWGMVLIRRQIAEAAAWERAGMVPQAEAAFERAKSIYDSFWLAPLQRRHVAGGLTMRLARFYLAQPGLGKSGREMVQAYLRMHPEDEEVAQVWIEEALRRESHDREAHALAERIGIALRHRPNIQKLLMQLYLADGRADFEAMQTYRRVWGHQDAMSDALIRPLARILLNENHLNDWALGIYLKGYALGDTHCLEGIAAGMHFLRPNENNRNELEAARRILSTLDEAHRRKLFRKLESPDPGPETGRADTPSETPVVAGANIFPRKVKAATLAGSRAMGRMLATLGPRLRSLGLSLQTSARMRRLVASALVVALLGVLTVVGWQSLGRRPAPEAPPEPPLEAAAPAPVTDPFTIQVAAYLRPEDAQRYVDRLKQQNVDAFWTKAASANRTWYQVKVSHFATREQARRYGEALKNKGLIDDFYVANYTP